MIVLPFRFRSVIAVTVVVCLAMGFFMVKDTQSKDKFEKISGHITYLEKKFNDLPNREAGKFRFLKLDNYPYAIELFVGKDLGDFKPKFEQVDNLKVGDPVTVYYYETNSDRNDLINRHVKFIDRQGINYFEQGSSLITIGIIVIVLCVLLDAFCFYLWKKGKMPF